MIEPEYDVKNVATQVKTLFMCIEPALGKQILL